MVFVFIIDVIAVETNLLDVTDIELVYHYIQILY